MGSTLIVRGLQKTYGARQVVHDVSLDVASGEVVGLLGPNGAGKTTSFYMIVGLVPSDGGEITLDGVGISRLPIHRRAVLGLSYLPQEASVFRKLTVEDNIRAVLELQREDGKPLTKARLNERLDTLLADLQIEEIARKPGLVLVGRRAAARRDCTRAGDRSALHPAGRAVCRRRPDCRHRDPAHRALLEGARHRRADYRPQRARDAGHLRPRLHHQSRARCWPVGRPDDIIDNPSVRRVYLGEHFRM